MDAVSQESQSRNVVSLAVRVLYLRNTSQIDELMRHSSVAIQQRWDFLGPTVDKSQPVQSALFGQIDEALQWQTDEIGEFIRNEHFMPELTEEQKDHLCAENVLYEYTDHQTLHAYAPFGQLRGRETMVVDVVWDREVGGWAYFNTKIIEATIEELKGTEGLPCMATTMAGAKDALMKRLAACKQDEAGSDDGYWDQFEGPESPPVFPEKDSKGAVDAGAGSGDESDDYWDKYEGEEREQAGEELSDKAQIGGLAAAQPLPLDSTKSKDLAGQSTRLSLAAAAVSAQAAGLSEAEFLEMAHATFESVQQQST
ncbi:hypothetical protein LPJ56_000972 [Coemansia sp. RSA 2599]|nr:hypothetical protein LPJ75_000571 [Coemansia sp. RSA 2598]KAJ1828647.1 hypothetical protein LPJ56_000972 [Coemansia sp. RSA 2599]